MYVGHTEARWVAPFQCCTGTHIKRYTPTQNFTHSLGLSLCLLFLVSYMFRNDLPASAKDSSPQYSILKNEWQEGRWWQGQPLWPREHGMFWQVKRLELIKDHSCNISQRNPSDLEPFEFLGCADLTGPHLCYHYCGSKLPGGRSQLIPNYICSHFKGLTSTHMCWQSMWHIKSCLNWRAGTTGTSGS